MTTWKVGDKFYRTSRRPWRGPNGVKGEEVVRCLCTVTSITDHHMLFNGEEVSVSDPMPGRKAGGGGGGAALAFIKEWERIAEVTRV